MDPGVTTFAGWPGMISANLYDPSLLLRVLASKYYMLASVVVLFFDYFLTFDLEVERLWKKAFTVTGSLLLLNRYYPLLIYPFVLYSVHADWSPEFCESFARFPFIAALISDAIIGIIIILRIYAIYYSHKKILLILLPLFVGQLLLGGWASDSILRAKHLPPGTGCIVDVPHQALLRFALLWGSSACFDSLIFVLTMYRTLSLRRSGLKTGLMQLFLRDGLLYFGIMTSAKLLNFVLFWTAVTANLVTLNWAFNNIITVIMVNRLVFNIHEEVSRDVIPSSDLAMQSSLSSTAFVAKHRDSRSTMESIDDEIAVEMV